MIKKLGAIIFASFLVCQSANGMLSYFGFGKKEKTKKQITPLKTVSLLEDLNTLPVQDEFKLFLKRVDAPLAYGCLCNYIRQKPDMLKKKFGKVIEGVGGWGTGKIFSIMAQTFGINNLMVDGMLSNEGQVTDIFASVCKKKKKAEPLILKQLLARCEREVENKLNGGELFARKLGELFSGIALNCIEKNQKKIPEIIIKEMVLGKKDCIEEQSGDDKSEGKSYKALRWVVKLVLNKCVSNGPEWKKFFGDMLQQIYTEKRKLKQKNKKKLLEMTE